MNRLRVDDPDLSTEANRLLTDELRAAVGDTPGETIRHVPESGRARLGATLGDNRLLLAVTFTTFVVVGMIVTLVTGSWWALVGAVAVHAVGTALVTGLAVQLTTTVEHVAPSTAARLEAAGVRDPDRALTDLAARAGGGVGDVVSSGHDRRTVPAAEDAPQAELEQRSALTPAAEPTAPAPERR